MCLLLEKFNIFSHLRPREKAAGLFKTNQKTLAEKIRVALSLKRHNATQKNKYLIHFTNSNISNNFDPNLSRLANDNHFH